MRVVGRYDVYWLVVIAAAVFAIFSRPLGDLLDYARDLDQRRGLQLLPGLLILTAALVFHQFRKRQEMREAAAAAATDARLAKDRAAEMERLVAFGHALARSLDRDSIQAAIAEHLPALTGGRETWAMMRTSSGWHPLTDLTDLSDDARGARERVASRAIGDPDAALSALSDSACFPLVVGGTPVGVLGVASQPTLTERQRSLLTATAALLAVTIKNAELFYQVRENSVRDSLTGCFNRKHALEVMDGELRRSRRSQMPLSLLMFDLDHFKIVNDTYGHLCGDAVLAAVGSRMHAVLRGSDLKCRYGGEEFLILLPDTPLAGARRVADTLRRDLEEHPVQWRDQTVVVTGSFGITGITPGEVDANVIIGRADAALYRAKEAGRNCVRSAEEHQVIV